MAHKSLNKHHHKKSEYPGWCDGMCLLPGKHPQAIILLALFYRLLPLAQFCPPNHSKMATCDSAPLLPITLTFCQRQHYLHRSSSRPPCCHPQHSIQASTSMVLPLAITRKQVIAQLGSMDNRYNLYSIHSNRNHQCQHSNQRAPRELDRNQRLGMDTSSCIAAQIFMSVPPTALGNAKIHCGDALAIQPSCPRLPRSRRNVSSPAKHA